MSLLFRRTPTPGAGAVTLPHLDAPPLPAPAGPAPLLLFLHGGRDRGDDLDLLLRWAPPRQIAEQQERPYRFIAPQIPADSTWPEHEAALLALIDASVADGTVDPRRIVLAGFSLGAAGAWQIVSRHPARFAGLIAVSGRLGPGHDLNALARVPTWVFHGRRDDKLPVTELEPELTQLRLRDADLRYTLYPQGDHFIADQAFSERGLQEWILARRAPLARASGVAETA